MSTVFVAGPLSSGVHALKRLVEEETKNLSAPIEKLVGQ